MGVGWLMEETQPQSEEGSGLAAGRGAEREVGWGSGRDPDPAESSRSTGVIGCFAGQGGARETPELSFRKKTHGGAGVAWGAQWQPWGLEL